MGGYIWTKERLSRLERYVKNGVPAKEIANMFDISRARIYQVLTQYGIDTPKRRRTQEKLTPEEYRIWKLILNARTRDSNCNIELEDLKPIPTHCEVLGIKLDYGPKQMYERNENSPSLDKIDPNKGYRKNNVKIISWRANRIKNNGTLEEHKKICKYMNKYLL